MIAMVCAKEGEQLESLGEMWYRRICTGLNLISTLALAVTAFLYCFLKEVQDTQGNCIFHLSLVLFILHVIFSYMFLIGTTIILPNACITKRE